MLICSFKKTLGHTNGDGEEAVGYINLEPRGEMWTGNTHTEVMSQNPWDWWISPEEWLGSE